MSPESAENERLRAALRPFARDVMSVSLFGALGHITREDLWRAHDALAENKRLRAENAKKGANNERN